MIEASSDVPRKSSEIFGIFRKITVWKRMSGLRAIFKTLQKSSGSVRNFSENRQKRHYRHVYIINKIIHACL